MGCSKNSVDGERFLGLLSEKNVQISNSFRNATIVVVNTCGFIEEAKVEAIDEILKAIELKKNKKIDKVFVIGCLVTRYKNELLYEIPELDGVFQVNEWQSLVKILSKSSIELPTEEILPRYLLTPKHYAYLRIADGCNRGCSYCSIPMMRGSYKSESLKKLVLEAEDLRKRGVKELIVIAQEVNDYGKDLNDGTSFRILLNELDQIGFPWIRVLYTHPPAFNDEFVETLSATKSIVPYIDYPIEHSHPSILWSMGRKKSPEFLLHWINKLRESIPSIAIRTSLIVGYPGEGEAEFKHLIDFVNESKFERLGVFTYSKEEGTRAGSIQANEVPIEVAKERQELLLDLGNEIAEEFHKSKLNQTVSVIIDEKQDQTYLGRSQWDMPEIDYSVTIENSFSKVGSIVKVKIFDVWEGGWKGDIANASIIHNIEDKNYERL